MKKHWFEAVTDGILLHLKVQPRAKETKVVGPQGEPPRLKIKLAAPPVDGKANQELIRFLQKQFQITQSQIKIIRGEKSANKDVHCKGIHSDQVENLIPEQQLTLL